MIMSNYPPPGSSTGYTQPEYSPQPQASGCGCGGCLGKVLIALGVVFFLIIALCCGSVFYMQSYVKNSITQQPQQVQVISDEIATIKVPAPLAPAFGGRFKVPFSGTYLGEGVVYTSPDKKSILVLASFSDAFGPQFKENLMKGLEAGPGENKSANNDELNENLKDTKESTIDRTIGGKPAAFRITEGTGVQSGKKKIKVIGDFQGKTGPAVLLINVEETVLSRDAVDEIIQSIEAGAQAEKE
jgi:hypothetical protein